MSRGRITARAGVLTALIVAASLVAGCGGGGKSSSTTDSGKGSPAAGTTSTRTLSVGSPQTLVLDPAKGIGDIWAELTNEPLLHLKPDGSIGPGLATGWRYIGSGNKDFEFTLRPNVRFSDGEPLTADAVKTWFKYMVEAKGTFASRIDVKSVEAVDERTVRLHLKSPNPTIPYLLSERLGWGEVSSPKAAANPSLFSKGSYGAGPYKLLASETVSGDHYTYVPNPLYYDKSRIKWGKIVVKVVANATSRLQALQAGQLDVIFGAPDTVSAAKQAGFDVVIGSQSTMVLWLKSSAKGGEPLADPRVRQAMNYALDRKTLTSALQPEGASPTSELLSSDGYDPKYREHYPYDPAKAKALLAAAGYPKGFTIRILSAGFDDPQRGLADAAAKYLGEVGIRAVITTDSTVEAFVKHYPDFPIVIAGRPVDASMFDNWATWQANKYVGWDDPVANRLWDDGRRAESPDEYWLELSQRISDQAYAVPVFETSQFMFASKEVGGVSYGKRITVNPVEWFPR